MTLAAMMRNAPCIIIVQLKVFAATWRKWVLELNVAMSESVEKLVRLEKTWFLTFAIVEESIWNKQRQQSKNEISGC